ncbi:MAG: DNA polymerase III subunit alpha [Deltaproteobacteria bacterium]|nr:DNA polymerase III subunit alpha [Deltaproteobacteria bacterium]
MAFVHLHVHSQYTLLDGTASPGALLARARELGQPALALTDRCNLFGAVEFFKAAGALKDPGIRPVLGCEVPVQPEGIAFQDPLGTRGGWSIVLLVENAEGYRNLCQLVTRAIFDGVHYQPRIDLDLLSRHREGLIALTSGLGGPVGRAVQRGRTEEARLAVASLLEILGHEHLFLELQDHGLAGQPEMNALARTLAADLGIATVVTNAVHYLVPEDAVTQDVLHAVGRAEALDDPDRPPMPTDQLDLKSEGEMRELFPDDAEAIDRTVEIADRCRFGFVFGQYHFPAAVPPDPDAETHANFEYFYKAFPPPRAFGLPSPEGSLLDPPPGSGTLGGYFRWYAEQGLALRLPDIPAPQHELYRQRLGEEIETIVRMGFPAYLLIVAEFINWAKDHDIPVGPGRGSAAGSLAAWAMRITDIDPIRFSLLFERFLNPERVSMPDIDVDFCQDRREEVIAHVRDRYGADLVSQIITYGKLQAKLAIRDVARVLSLTFKDADQIAKMVPDELNITLAKALEDPSFRVALEGDPRIRRVAALARRVEGTARQTGVHAAGVVIADHPLVRYAPLYRDGPDGGPVIQFDMKSVETIGLVKFDFLGLKTLDQIRDAVRTVERNTGQAIDIARIPLDDAATYRLLQQGDTLGVFQVESAGMRDLLVRLKPGSIDEVIALVALHRPGPMKAGMVDDYVDRKHGRARVAYPHPDLEPILSDTYGVVLYQEQVMRVAQVLAGYSLAEADLLRRAMGKKQVAEMAAQKSRFLEGARARAVPEDLAVEVFDTLEKFAGYGFNKSHSAAYGLIAYQTAWLKAHHRAEFMAALLSIEAGNTDKVFCYLNDCRRAGLQILPPDVNSSEAGFDVPRGDRRSIRFGLEGVKGVGSGAVKAILAARQQVGGRFTDLVHFLEHVDSGAINRKVVENLIFCGAFDTLGSTRAALHQGLDGAIRAAQQAVAEQASPQVGLFGSRARAPWRLADAPEWPTMERLRHEREALGFFISGHPLDAWGDDLARHVTCTIGAALELPDGREVTLAGMVTGLHTVVTRRGDRMAFVTLEDAQASVEFTFFAERWQASRSVLESQVPVRVRGKVQRRGDGEARFLAENAEILSEVIGRCTREIRVCLEEVDLVDDRIQALAALFARFPGPCPVKVQVRVGGRALALLELSDRRASADDALRNDLETLFGRPDVVRFL